MFTKIKNWTYKNKIPAIIFCFVLFLLVFRVGYRTFWMDETMVLNYLHQGPIEFIIEYIRFPDNHPPLYYFLVLLVSKVLPWSELTIRFVSILSGLGTVILVYRFMYRITDDKKIASLASFFTGFSSYFVLISQMARYHGLAGLSALLVLYYFYRVYTEGFKKELWWRYLGALMLTGYIDYPHFIYVVLITNTLFLYQIVRKHSIISLKNWLIGNVCVAVVCSPLAWMLYHRIIIQGDGGWGDMNLLGNSWLSIIGGVFFHIYAYFFGENIFPWDYVIVGVGCTVLMGVFVDIIGFFRNKKENKSYGLMIGLGIALIILNTLFMNKADARYNFTVYPKFGFIAYPIWIMIFVISLSRIQSKKIRNTLFVLWGIVELVGLTHFYRVENYLNPSYFRTFEAFQYVENHSEDGDYVAITPDASQGVYDFYQTTYFKKLKPLGWNGFQSSTIPASTRVWFFSTSADGSEESVATESKIPVGYTIISQFDSVPLDPKFKMLKEKFLNRPSYTYKYTVFLLKKI